MGSDAPPAPPHAVASRSALVIVCAAMAVVGINTTAIGVTSRGIADELDTSIAVLEWIVGAYLIAAAAFSLIGGRLGDAIGRKRTLLLGIAVFAAGCGLAAAAPGPGVLIAARSVQGLGAALVMPASIEVLAAFAPDGEPSKLFRARGIVYASAFGIGPLVGGILTDSVSWRAVFVAELAVLVVALVVAIPFLRARSDLPKRPTHDLLGGLVVAPLIVLLVLGMSQGRRWGWSWRLVAVAVGVVALGAVLRAVERRAEHPLIHPGLLRDRVVLGANLATLGASIGMLGLVYFFNLFAQSAAVFRLSAVEVAVALIPFTLSIVLFAQAAAFLSSRIGYRGPVIVGLGISTAGFLLLARTEAGVTEAGIAIPLALCGIGSGIANAGLTGPAVLVEQRGRIDEASGLVSLTRFLGSAIAVAVGTATYLSVGTSTAPTELAAADTDPAEMMVGSTTFDDAAATLEEDLRKPFEAAVGAATTEAFAATMRVTAVGLLAITVTSAWLLGTAHRDFHGYGPDGGDGGAAGPA